MNAQDSLGNRGVLRRLQAKLNVSQPGDQQVVSAQPATTIHRKCADCSGSKTTCPKCDEELPESREGQQSSAHELANVVQKSEGRGVPSSLDHTVVPSTSALSISSTNDPSELEANRVAAEVMRMPAPSSSPVLQRKCEACEEEDKVHRSATSESLGTAPTIVNQVLSQTGQPLLDSTRSFFEPQLGADLSAVRVHTNTQAARSAEAVHAKAYTVGNSIAFAEGHYAPHSESGKGLLAHELVHVVQQGNGTPETIRRQDDVPESPVAVLRREVEDGESVSILRAIRHLTPDQAAAAIGDVGLRAAAVSAFDDAEMVAAVKSMNGSAVPSLNWLFAEGGRFRRLSKLAGRSSAGA